MTENKVVEEKKTESKAVEGAGTAGTVATDSDTGKQAAAQAVTAKATDAGTTKTTVKNENTNGNSGTETNTNGDSNSTGSKNINILDELVKKQIISKDQIEVAVRERKRNDNNEDITSILVRMGFISDKTLSEILNANSDVKNFDLKSLIIDQKLVRKIPKGFATQNKVIAVGLVKQTVTVATTDIFNIIVSDQLKRFFPQNYKIQLVYASESDITNAIDRYYDYDMSIDGILREIETGVASSDEQAASGDYKSPMVRLVDAILTDAVRVGASDLHFEPENFFLRLRYRIDGKMEQIKAFHKDYWSSIAVRIKIMSGMNIAETRKAQDGRINAQILGRNIDFRVSSQPTVDGENIVMRILDEKKAILNLDKLGYFPKTQNIIKKCIKRPEGIVIITGPTGSGKTTTLYTVLSMINSIEKNIMTLENPVEYRIPLLRQTNINPDIGLDFADGIRTLMRQDPDVILVGEIRDRETALAAVQAAMTGHQVFSSLHTNDAFSAIPRLMQIGVEPYLLSGSLICVIAQRLARKLCPHCKKKRPVTDQEKGMITRVLGEKIASKVPELYDSVGCEKCRNTGFAGRMAVAEIIDIDKELDEMITRRATKKEFTQYLSKNGFIPMQIDGMQKVIMGYTTLNELTRVVDMTSAMEV
ncbi:MAG: type II/IV secretion system protein [Rickettsiales bacterium]|nr:type II/IV secretion system protein [Rickettsiales bacterium]